MKKDYKKYYTVCPIILARSPAIILNEFFLAKLWGKSDFIAKLEKTDGRTIWCIERRSSSIKPPQIEYINVTHTRAIPRTWLTFWRTDVQVAGSNNLIYRGALQLNRRRSRILTSHTARYPNFSRPWLTFWLIKHRNVRKLSYPQPARDNSDIADFPVKDKNL